MKGEHERTVLVVEDDPDLRDGLVELLAGEGFRTLAATNGREALHLLHRERVTPCLILLDLTMPVMSGWQFREEQLSDTAISSIPVVVMTAVDPGTIRANALVHKPFEADELLGAISRVTM
jgi:CheY-like chemotaxis protein